MAEVKSVAVLGTGIMGAPIARHLADAGLETRAWNRTRDKAEPLAAEGIEVADSPSDAVGGADVVITMLANADAVREVMAGDEGALTSIGDNGVWAQMSTIGIAATEEMGGLAGEAG